MALSEYHQKFQQQPDEEIQRKIRAKEQELKAIFSKIRFRPTQHPVRIAVLGCGDKRFVPAHKALFEKLLDKPVIVTTLDITTEHLVGQKDIVQHDCTKPIPGGPYNITYAHVLLKFIETEKQWDVIKNSYEAMTGGGVAIHILDKEDCTTKSVKLPSGHYSVPLKRWKQKLEDAGKLVTEIQLKTGPSLKHDALALVIQSGAFITPAHVEKAVGEVMQDMVSLQRNVDVMLKPYGRVFAQISEAGNEIARAFAIIQNPPWAAEMRKIVEFQKQAEQQLQPLFKNLVLPNLPVIEAKDTKEIAVKENDAIEVIKPKEPPIRYVPESELNERLGKFRLEVRREITEVFAEQIDPRLANMEELLKKALAHSSQGKYIFLYLDRGGDLYRDPKIKYCYPLAGSGMRLKLLRALGYDFIPTVDLQVRAGSGSVASIRNAVNEINRNVHSKLKLKEDLIVGKPGSGYRINDMYIVQKV